MYVRWRTVTAGLLDFLFFLKNVGFLKFIDYNNQYCPYL